MSKSVNINSILPNGDCGLVLQFEEAPHLLLVIHALAAELIDNPFPGMINVIPGKDTLVMVFASPINELAANGWSVFRDDINLRIKSVNPCFIKTKTHEIPVCYDATVAVDVVWVCEQLGLSHEQLIDCHTEEIYQVDMLGFLPGFAYLSGNQSTLNIARKQTPSLRVPAGSVAIANQQTGIYSLASPGGWYVIGRTPLALIDWQREQQPMLLKPMDQVQFKSISLSEYNRLMSDADGH